MGCYGHPNSTIGITRLPSTTGSISCGSVIRGSAFLIISALNYGSSLRYDFVHATARQITGLTPPVISICKDGGGPVIIRASTISGVDWSNVVGVSGVAVIYPTASIYDVAYCWVGGRVAEMREDGRGTVISCHGNFCNKDYKAIYATAVMESLVIHKVTNSAAPLMDSLFFCWGGVSNLFATINYVCTGGVPNCRNSLISVKTNVIAHRRKDKIDVFPPHGKVRYVIVMSIFLWEFLALNL